MLGWKFKFMFLPFATIIIGSLLLASFYDLNVSFSFRDFAFFIGDADANLAGTKDNPICIISVNINKILGFGRYGIVKEEIKVFGPDNNPVPFEVSDLPTELRGRSSFILFAYPNSGSYNGRWYIQIKIYNLDDGSVVNVLTLEFNVNE